MDHNLMTASCFSASVANLLSHYLAALQHHCARVKATRCENILSLRALNESQLASLGC